MRLKFFSIGSGSSGNCYFLGTDDYGMLIDAGVGIRAIQRALKEKGMDLQRVMAVFVTHDHSDHIKTASCLSDRHNIPVYATEAVHEGIRAGRHAGGALLASRRYLVKDVPLEWRDFRLTAFDVPHDGSDNVGYYITCGEHRFTFATDVGHITETVARYLRLGNHLIVEANYDEEMLREGNYPLYLKDRIGGACGHLSNRETAEFLAQNTGRHLKNIWLCHLSKDNNRPEVACRTVETALLRQGIRVGRDVMLTALERTSPSEVFYFE
ncbi:MAG: MBL fold metallo-hydrolase [Dysgonamonadaceae bacterium]|nr:MBL fold metallo-hydrolase [Dysgonamonadaceae bacterium]